ncbi:TPA: hypothetical protein ACOFC4_000817 [Stenotrophomonas maltophilia]|uniref:hypothetical protein n=1 Tax=Stenotrophomonas maltophilia TaxID=40324 RepID=UPI001FA6D8DB|nr:hypothetical protein [Stenotrophomonas maltophilia]HDX0836455.1 hypothetical protein [Stenotrophomonas maltophilia]
MVVHAVLYPYWNGDSHVPSSKEKIGDSLVVCHGQGRGAGEIAAWLDADFGSLGRGSELRARSAFAVPAGCVEGSIRVHHGEGHAVLRAGDLFLVYSRWNPQHVALLTQSQILAVLESYGEFRSMNPRKKHRPPMPFTIQYEAEGEDAIRRFTQAGGCFDPEMDAGP